MKKVLFLIVCVLLLVSCSSLPSESQQNFIDAVLKNPYSIDSIISNSDCTCYDCPPVTYYDDNSFTALTDGNFELVGYEVRDIKEDMSIVDCFGNKISAGPNLFIVEYKSRAFYVTFHFYRHKDKWCFNHISDHSFIENPFLL